MFYMKYTIFLAYFVFFAPIMVVQGYFDEPTERIVNTYWENKARSTEKDTVFLDHNNVLISFKGECVVDDQVIQQYYTWISRFSTYQELDQEEKKSFFGYFLKLLENKFFNNQMINIDNYTSCIVKDNAYECATVVDKSWAEKQLKRALKE